MKYKFEAGSYGGPGAGYLPSIACLKGSARDGWSYHFVLVRQDTSFGSESEAVDAATGDLSTAFQERSARSMDLAVAEVLRNCGYKQVEGFNVVKWARGTRST